MKLKWQQQLELELKEVLVGSMDSSLALMMADMMEWKWVSLLVMMIEWGWASTLTATFEVKEGVMDS